ncbi:MAG: thioredoxin domain-containing protein [Planctomycetaceae bacterium]|jgi:uncharacterized protein YyaL (SSP411 family)|nr:thioredoxin domain-containing protein [Phycisphaerales bacterium]MCE2652176.1 thioredoxin domain-containing protein [Planctomycetaceae bacterium]
MSTTTADHPANRLAAERSPYLRQHAHNPVDWWPWCPEALAEARRRDVPVFLSVGYSTCYWCHVMERESFTSPSTAKVMNELYVNIKVDREERPDIDDLYMAAVQMLTGSGGWPMSVFLDPHTLEPFWGGTYFPPVAAFGRPSFTQVLQRLAKAWAEQRQEVRQQAATVAAAVREKLSVRPDARPVLVGPADVTRGIQSLLTIFDASQGGFGGAPKFPQPVYLELLALAAPRAAEEQTRQALDLALCRTLDAMAIGGLFDQIGGGFHRYAVDGSWTVPHFEKMLYDNAQLLGVYAHAAQAYEDGFYRRVVDRTVEYLDREMTVTSGPLAGAFCAAQDAEVAGREGANYLWLPAEVDAAIDDPELAAFARRIYGLNGAPNFRDPHHPADEPRFVLRLEGRPDELALTLRTSEAELISRLDRVNVQLLAARDLRPRPRLDDKLLVAWNGMMITSLARAAAALGRPDLLARAQRAASAVLSHFRVNGMPVRSLDPAGGRLIGAVLEDFAHLATGLLAIARAADLLGEQRPPLPAGVFPGLAQPLKLACDLLDEAQRLFGDSGEQVDGGLYDTPAGRDDLFVRTRHSYDGAVPSASSVMLNACIDAAELDPPRRGRWLSRAHGLLLSLSREIAQNPASTANSTRALLRLLGAEGEALVSRLAAAGAVDPQRAEDLTPAADADDPVELFVSADEVHVSDDAPGEFMLKLVIPDGLHINDAQAGAASNGAVIPLRVDIVGGTGLAAYADYPAGSPLATARSAAGPAPTYGVLVGEVAFQVVVVKEGAVEGEPRLVVTYQACSDSACLAPVTRDLPVSIDVG